MCKKKLFLIIIPIILFILLSLFIRENALAGFESWIYEESIEHMNAFLTFCLTVITHIGGGIGVVVICIIIFANKLFREKIGIQIGTGLILSLLTNQVLKYVFARERPNILRLVSATNYSFPSGHAMVNMTLYALLVIYCYKFIENKKLKSILIPVMMGLTVIIGFTRIYLGVHYAGDIIGGWLLGFTISVIVYSFFNKNKPARKMIEDRIG